MGRVGQDNIEAARRHSLRELGVGERLDHKVTLGQGLLQSDGQGSPLLKGLALGAVGEHPNPHYVRTKSGHG